MGLLATSYGATAAEAGHGLAAVVAVGVHPEGRALLVVGFAVGVGAVSDRALFASCRLSAIGICVLRRSWSESLKVCCGECDTCRRA
jgi:hypothetical protein